MNAKTANLIALSALLMFCLFSLGQPAFAQSPNSNCKRAKAQQVFVFDPATNTTTGTITNGGGLNGTTLEVLGSSVLPTPDPTTVTFIGDFTLTTIHGQLKGSEVVLFDFVASAGAALLRINPTTSTGKFAGPTVFCISLVRSSVLVHSWSKTRLQAKSVSQATIEIAKTGTLLNCSRHSGCIGDSQ
jgi:hypothetical protein